MVRGLVAAATPEALVAAVAASPVAVAAVAASPVAAAVVMVGGEGARTSASSSEIDAITTDRRLHDRSLWPPQNTARMHSRLGEQMPH